MNVPSRALEPIMLDASVFGTVGLATAIAECERKEFYVSQTLYDHFKDEESALLLLNHFRDRRSWQEELPRKVLFGSLSNKLKPYPYKKDFVGDVYRRFAESPLPQPVREVVLDEWSFLREKSSLITSTKNIASYLHKWGVAFLDASNQKYDQKHNLLQPIRAPKFLLGVVVAVGGVFSLGMPVATAGVALALFDP